MRLPSPKIILATNLVGAIAALAWVLWSKGASAITVLAQHPSWPLFAAFVLTMVILWAIATVRWRLLVAGVCEPPALGSLMWYRLAGQSVSMLVPSAKLGGEPVRGYRAALAHRGRGRGSCA